MEITILTGKVCSLCDTLKRGLDLKGVEFKAVEMTEQEGMKLIIANGIKSIPQVFVDGELIPRNKYKEVLGVCID